MFGMVRNDVAVMMARDYYFPLPLVFVVASFCDWVICVTVHHLDNRRILSNSRIAFEPLSASAA